MGRTLVTLKVTAQDPRHTRSVHVTVTRASFAVNASLSNLVTHVVPGRR
eukprot:CAMPEP_0197601764 /NCGR_PEP_ID=MMETSP1326-20131121/35921_1 /TAXON_ID=1155430 /ORGANISM="Genus nov. species nov., Strain RCC2288" /LENGTH=48 /DNA_ID= /DNA_START= /DNA_END= /DNA_ORIENTATION=